MKTILLFSIILILIIIIGLLGFGAYVVFTIGKEYGIIYVASLIIGTSIGIFIASVTNN